MQLVPANGVKLYKAHITKGNNGVLIRAALKNRYNIKSQIYQFIFSIY